MICKNCGKQLREDAKVCSQCGTPVNPQPTQKEKMSEGTKVLIGSLVALILLLLVVATGLFFFAFKSYKSTGETSSIKVEEMVEETAEKEDNKKENENAPETEASEGEAIVAEEAVSDLSDSQLAQTIAKYNQPDAKVAVIDVYAENYTPGARDAQLAWDKNLFYTLEDVDPASGTDGLINGYSVTRKRLWNAVSGNEMEYEIYMNPATGKVNKIVSIEYMTDKLEIVDYYYDDAGKVSFIFMRNDTNYVPSYAVTTKDGQRFYFNTDCMVKWRVVSGGVQTNYVLGQAAASVGYNPNGSVFLYDNLEAGAKANFDATEKRMINAAYNTYNIVLAAEGVSQITGYVYNSAGGPLEGAKVTLIEDGNNERLYEGKTDGEGMYRILVPSTDNRFRMIISSENCVDVTVYNVEINNQTLSGYQDAVTMVEKTDERYAVDVQTFDALHYAADGNGMERLQQAAVYIRDGLNHKEGGVVAQGTTDSAGKIQVELAPGMYTAEIVKDGFDNTYHNFAAKTDAELVQINASPKLAAGEVRIVLTWGRDPQDLDSHLFTPYDNVFNDSTYHIWYRNQTDAVGNNLDVDDTDGYGPETMTIPILKNGLYKYYVADYTHCSGNDPTSFEMSNSGATVNVYTSNGLTATFTVPTNQPGVIWEVFEIRNGLIVPSQRYYSNIEDKSWWHRD